MSKDSPPFYKWFTDGVTNTCYNALDVHIDEGRGDKTALIYDSPITGNKSKFSFKQLILNFFRYPLMSFKIISAIHFEALLLWIKGAIYRKRDKKIKNNLSYEKN